MVGVPVRSQGAGPDGFPGDSKGSTPTSPLWALGAQCAGGHAGAPPIRGGTMDWDTQRELDSLRRELENKLRDLDYRVDDVARELRNGLSRLEDRLTNISGRGDV